jgi:hypothetical protein
MIIPSCVHMPLFGISICHGGITRRPINAMSWQMENGDLIWFNTIWYDLMPWNVGVQWLSAKQCCISA